jgi:serine/threonine-protein kinase
MFRDEARLAMRVQHPNVVGTFDVISTDTELLLVMDFVLGESLDRLYRKARKAGRHSPVPVVCGIVAGVLAGLHAAHEARDEEGEALDIVHRDVSPQNVIVGIDGVPRVVDFGVAKAAGRLHTTQQGQVKGKLAYMAPEQLTLAKLDRRVDVFAAAVVLWEGLAGQRLFGADSPGATVTNVLDKPIVAPSTFNADVPAAVDAVVLRGLSRHADLRFATARDMAVALEQACPPATAHEIGEWVEHEAGDAVRGRAALVADVESRSSSEARALAPVDARGAGGAASTSLRARVEAIRDGRSRPRRNDADTLTSSSVIGTPGGAGSRRSRRGLVAMAIGLTSLAVAPLVVSRMSRVSTPAAQAASSSAGMPPIEGAATPLEPASAAVPSIAASLAGTVVAPAASLTPPVTRAAVAAGRPSPSAHPLGRHPSAPRKPDCRNPFTIGAGGIRVPRPECF